MTELSERAVALLLSAKPVEYPNFAAWFIDRTLGWKTCLSGGQKWTRPDVAELYRAGLIAEWFSPGSPPCYLTSAGEAEREKRAPK